MRHVFSFHTAAAFPLCLLPCSTVLPYHCGMHAPAASFTAHPLLPLFSSSHTTAALPIYCPAALSFPTGVALMHQVLKGPPCGTE
eukprot:scaffold23603_cov17-Tisochrysis_lutea.AAC.1